MFGSMKMWIVGLAGLAIVTAITLGYSHYTSIVADLAVSKANEVKLELAIDVQKDTIVAVQENAADWKDAYAALEAQAEVVRQIAVEAQAEQERLNGLFAEHDLNELAGAKPGLIESRLNSGTARIGCMLETASGAVGNLDCPN